MNRNTTLSNLCRAIVNNDTKNVKELCIYFNNSLFDTENDEIHPIHIAAIRGCDNTEMIKFLVQQNLLMNLDVEDKYGNTGLHLAIKYNFKEKVKLLLHYGSSTDHKNIYGHTPLYLAYKYNYVQIAEILIVHYANINLRYRFEIEEITETILENACRYKNIQFVFLFLKYNALFNYNNDSIKSFYNDKIISKIYNVILSFYMAKRHPNELNVIVKIKEYKHFEIMLNELIEMKNHKIANCTAHNSTSLLSFLTCDISTAENIMSEYNIEIGENLYPIYRSRIKLQIEKVRHRQLCVNLAVKTLQYIAPDSIKNDESFPYGIIANILTNQEIKNFIRKMNFFYPDDTNGMN